ncbi:hypothetical protein Ciccas_013986, partial [Cichlidogyrus casuarinus]
GYFLTSDVDTILRVAALSGKNEEKLMAFNLSAPFLSEFFTKQMEQVLPYVDILFGNREEASAFAKSKKIEDSAEAVCNYFCNLKRPDEMIHKQRIAIITNGKSAIVYQSGQTKGTYTVSPMDHQSIVDTNGAGDGFVAGFLYQFQQNKSLDDSIEMGIKCAKYVLRQSGFSLGDRDQF